MYQYPESTVGGLVIAPDGDILLVRSPKWLHLYSLPGGRVEKGEATETAFQREIKEETGLEVVNTRFALIQDCIFSEEFWQPDRHFIMHDYIADLHPSYDKSKVVLNDEAEEYLWVNPAEAIKLPLQKECRNLVEWHYANMMEISGVVGVKDYKIKCIVGILPEEREQEQELLIDVKVKANYAHVIASKNIADTICYTKLAELCSELAVKNQYLLLETFAYDIIHHLFQRYQIKWASVTIRKPAAIPFGCVFVEFERNLEDVKWHGP